jgi:hypothetical protein
MIHGYVSFQFNFVGKLLGPKGNSLKRLQEDTMTKMAILGRGSMRDKQKVSKKIHITSSNSSSFSCYFHKNMKCVAVSVPSTKE